MPRPPHSCLAPARPGQHLPHRRRALAWFAAGIALPLVGCDQLLSTARSKLSVFKGVDITGASYGRDFALSDFDGRRRTLADFRGKVLMLYFGFVQCPDVCPTALTRAAGVMQALGPQSADLQVVFVTVDPERDTPALLREYMKAFHPSFLALTGSADEIRKTADEFKVFYQKVPTGSSYTMDHTALSYLFDRQGRLRVALRHEQTVDDYTADIRVLLGEAGS